MGVFGTLVAGVGTAVVVGLGSALFSYLAPGNVVAIAIVGAFKATGSGIAHAASAVWWFVNLPVPLWAFGALALLCVRLWRRQPSSPAATIGDASSRSLIEVLGTADGNPVEVNVVAKFLGWPKIQVETVANDLHAAGFVNVRHHGYSGWALDLTVKGKRFVLAERLTGDDALREKLRRAAQGWI